MPRFIFVILLMIALPALAQFPPTAPHGKSRPAAEGKPPVSKESGIPGVPAKPAPVAKPDPAGEEMPLPPIGEPAMKLPKVAEPMAEAVEPQMTTEEGEEAAASEEIPANTLSDEEKTLGWKLLFDGKKLLGLRGAKPGDPLTMGWVIEKDAIKLPKPPQTAPAITGGTLQSIELYADFELRFEFKLTNAGAGGIYYLFQEIPGSVRPPLGHEYQIADDASNPMAKKGGALQKTGALTGVLPAGPNANLLTAEASGVTAEQPWNSGRLVVKGNHVEHWLNNDLVLEYDLGSSVLKQAVATNRAKVPMTFGTKLKSRVALADEGYEIAFRNLKIRPVVANTVTRPAGNGSSLFGIPVTPIQKAGVK